jgi:energy-coupling factor transporter ATP-binding protein EcfA2
LFYENERQRRTLRAMRAEWARGEHLLLLGNQGVGKNKLADRLLQTLRRPRRYVQLHRDSTVAQLTSRRDVEAGRLVSRDAPLVSAARHGHVLVVDEADKAPAHVTAALRSLAEDGEMLLADGRRISRSAGGPRGRGAEGGGLPERARPPTARSPATVPLHPRFRLVVLANRAGFPFRGNDFLGSMRAVFSVFAVDNPDPASELELLRRYAPSVPEAALRTAQRAFRTCGGSRTTA